MKFPLFFVLLSLAVALFLTNAHAEDIANSDPLTEIEEPELEEFLSIQPFFADTENNSTQTPGLMEPFRKCIRIRCPKNCIVCICKCIKWR